jgi:uncharacterized membrane protein
MKGMTLYYLSRAAVSAAFGLLFALTGTAAWVAVLIGAGLFILFLLAPRSGRYAVHPELGVTALRRDERSQLINDKAGRNAFVVSMLVLAGLTLYFGATGVIPLAMVKLVMASGILTYFLSDLWLRRAQQP